MLLMSAAEYIWISIHTKHMPGYVWPQSRCLCLSSTLLLGQPCWGQKSPVKTNCPSRETFWSGAEQWTVTSTGGENGSWRLGRWAGWEGFQAATGNQSAGSTGLLGRDWSKRRGPPGTAVTAEQTGDGHDSMGKTRTVWTREKNLELTEVEAMGLACEEQGLLMAECCGGDPVWTRPVAVGSLLAQPPSFLPSHGAGFPRNLSITDTDYTTRSCITAGKSLPDASWTTDGWTLFQKVESQNHCSGWMQSWKIIWSNLSQERKHIWDYLARCAVTYWKPLVWGLYHVPGENVERDTWGETTRNWRTGLTVSGCLRAVLVQDVGDCQSEQAGEERPAGFPCQQHSKEHNTAVPLQMAIPARESNVEAIAEGSGETSWAWPALLCPERGVPDLCHTESKGCKEVLIPWGSNYQETNII